MARPPLSKTQDKINLAAHEHATNFDLLTEHLCWYSSACHYLHAPFAHTSNEVSNAFGPFAIIYHICVYASIVTKKAPVPVWILVLGGVAIDIGLLT
ncbi:hypothetical protein BGZ92_009365 [Podila epicladia]|nr:hypothetical protein BGZ92_009365 [Podila epicladia]